MCDFPVLPLNSWHCLIPFRLKPLDVAFMKAIHNKVNIVPVIAKADTLTLKEQERLKKRILMKLKNVTSKSTTYLMQNQMKVRTLKSRPDFSRPVSRSLWLDPIS